MSTCTSYATGPGPWRRLGCWLTGLGVHRIDILAASYGAPWICTRCGKNCSYNSAAIGRP